MKSIILLVTLLALFQQLVFCAPVESSVQENNDVKAAGDSSNVQDWLDANSKVSPIFPPPPTFPPFPPPPTFPPFPPPPTFPPFPPPPTFPPFPPPPTFPPFPRPPFPRVEA